MMRLPSRLVFLFVCLLIAAPAWAQVGPLAYVSTGPSSPSQVYSLNTSSGATTLLVSTNGADYEGLVVGPDNNSGDNALGIFNVVYACSTSNSTIVRFNAAATSLVANPEIIYQGGAGLQHPQCGRITSSGDLIVTSKDGGWWIFPSITRLALGGAGTQIPTQLRSTPPGSVDEGIALKNIGDLLIVDNANNQVFRSPAPLYSADSVFISSGLSNPFGIARRSDGQIYVSNQASKPFIEHFEASGSVATSCQRLAFNNKDTLNFMQMSPGDTLFVAGATGGNTLSSGALFQVDASPVTGCLSLTKTFSPGLPPLVGVALALPNFSASQVLSTPAAGGSGIANFGYAAIEVVEASGSCSLTVTATPTPAALLSSDIGTIIPAIAAAPAVDEGWDGYETVLDTTVVSAPPGCLASDGQFHYLFATSVPLSVTSPETISCSANTSCIVGNLEGVYPLGGLLPQDFGTKSSKGTTACKIFLANSTAGATNNEAGTFCLYESPVNNTFEGQPPSSLPIGNQLNVKFKLASTQGNCQNGPYITDATALLSVAQIADAKGNSVFVPFTIVLNGIVSPFYNPDKTNQQYTAKWDTSQCILPSGVTEDCPQGTYSLTTVFTSNNTSFTGSTDSIYTTQTTLLTIGKQ
jgi:hypothetical protein